MILVVITIISGDQVLVKVLAVLLALAVIVAVLFGTLAALCFFWYDCYTGLIVLHCLTNTYADFSKPSRSHRHYSQVSGGTSRVQFRNVSPPTQPLVTSGVYN